MKTRRRRVTVAGIDANDPTERSLRVTVNGNDGTSFADLSLTDAARLRQDIDRELALLEAGADQSRPFNGKAVVAFVLGVLAFGTVGLTTPVGIPLSHIALRRSAEMNGRGKVLSIIAMVLNYSCAGLWVIFWLAYFGTALLATTGPT